MENFLFALNTVLPFLLYIAFGYGVRISGLADEDFMKRLNKVIFQAFFPILMFNNLYSIPEGMTLICVWWQPPLSACCFCRRFCLLWFRVW